MSPEAVCVAPNGGLLTGTRSSTTRYASDNRLRRHRSCAEDALCGLKMALLGVLRFLRLRLRNQLHCGNKEEPFCDISLRYTAV